MLGTTQYHDYFDSELAQDDFELFADANHYRAGNVMMGITNRKRRFGHASISSGLGFIWGEVENNVIHKNFATLSWPVEAAASVNLFPFVGINLKVFSNINTEHFFFGFGMDLQLGKLRNIHWQELIPN